MRILIGIAATGLMIPAMAIAQDQTAAPAGAMTAQPPAMTQPMADPAPTTQPGSPDSSMASTPDPVVPSGDPAMTTTPDTSAATATDPMATDAAKADKKQKKADRPR